MKENLDVKYYKASKKGPINNLAILFLGGSEGGFPKLYDINYYTRLGISCLSVSYFSSKNTGAILDKIDLEYIRKSIDYFKKKIGSENKKIVIFGYSKGAELALVSASIFHEIKGVFALNPSFLVFQSPGSLMNYNYASSWKYEGEELSFTPLDYSLNVLK